MKNEIIYKIYGWMLTELSLKGSDLIIYALIFHNSRDGELYTASYREMSAVVGISNSRIIECVTKLEDLGYVVVFKGNMKKRERNSYSTNFSSLEELGIDYMLNGKALGV